MLYGYPLDGVVLTTGCDKTTPACLMAAATVNIPAIVLSGGPMLNGWFEGERTGSGTIVWKARELLAAGEIDEAAVRGDGRLLAPVARPLQHDGHREHDEQPGRGAGHVPARLRGHPGAATATAGRWPTCTGRRIVEMVHENLSPSDIMTRDAFENAIVVNSAIGGSTNSPDPHHRDRPAHRASSSRSRTGRRIGHDVRCWSTAAGRAVLGEEFHRAGGVPAVMES